MNHQLIQKIPNLLCRCYLSALYYPHNKTIGNLKRNVNIMNKNLNFRQELLPDLYLHFQSQGFHTSMYASSWFLTLYATSFSLSLSCRIMDLFISEVSVRHLIPSVSLLSSHGFINFWGRCTQPCSLSLFLSCWVMDVFISEATDCWKREITLMIT